MALAALQPSYGIRPGTYGSLAPTLNPDGSIRRVPLDASISPDPAAGVMAPGGLTPYQLRAQQDSIAEGGGSGAGAVWVQPDPDGNGGGFWDTSGAYMGTPGPNGVSYQDWIGNQRPGTGSYQSSKGMFGDIWNSGIGGKIAIGGLAAMGGAALGGYGAAADAATGAGEAGVGVGAGTGVAGGIGEGSASTAATGVAPAATQGVVDTGLSTGAGTGAGVGAGTGAGTGALDEAAMTQAARTASLNSLASQGITTGGAGAAAGAGAGTAMSRILDGTATTADWLSVGGNLAGTGLGIAGARNQANAFNDLANKYMAFGAPSRSRYEASMTPGFDPNSIPGYSGAVDTASKGILARLSATGGNPYGNPGGLIEANKQIISGTALPAIQDYQRLNAGTGGYAGFNAAAPGAATAGIGAQGGVYNAIGSGLAGLTNPQPSIYETLARLGVQGLS